MLLEEEEGTAVSCEGATTDKEPSGIPTAAVGPGSSRTQNGPGHHQGPL